MKKIKQLLYMAAAILIITFSCLPAAAKTAAITDASDFVVVSDQIPDVLQEIRYYSAYNFVGSHIDGYDEPLALMTRESVAALKNAAADFREKGYVIKIYDAYRPQRAVNHFMRWGNDVQDTKMKAYFYPTITNKADIVDLGYVARKSGHSRGSTLDMTIVNMKTGAEIDTGEHFDYFGERSHTEYTGITPQQQANRQFIKGIMEKNGFIGIDEEWWHFTLQNEPYPDTFFDFPVSRAQVTSAKK